MHVKNRSCIRTLSWRTLWAARGRNLIAIAAIALTALLFTSLFTVVLSIQTSYESYTFRQIGGCAHGTFKNVTEDQAAALSAHDKVKAAGKRITIGMIDSGTFAKVPAEVSFMDDNCAAWSFAVPTTGRAPQAGKEIALDTRALQLLGVEPTVGAEVSLTYTVGPLSEGPYEKTETFTLVGWWDYDDLSPVHFLNISEDYARAMETEALARGQDPFRVDLNVMLASAVDIQGQMEQVETDLGYAWEEAGEGPVVPIGVNWGYTSAQLGESLDAVTLAAIVAFLALVIFTGYCIIYTIFQISVTGDIRFYGLLKTIGVTRRQLRRIIRQQALLLCAAGIPVGLLLGYGVGALLTPVVMARTDLGAGVSAVSTSPGIFLASALFALVTVLLSCARPGRLAAKVSPVEAARCTEGTGRRKKGRSARGAKVHHMAFANLGRNKGKTVLVVVSLSLSVVLLDLLVTFTGGFDLEKYLAQQSCADFVVSSAEYFRCDQAEGYLSQEDMAQLQANTTATLSGSGYQVEGAIGWMTEAAWRAQRDQFGLSETVEEELAGTDRRGDLVSATAQIEGLDEDLFAKLTLVEGDLAPLLQPDSHAIALVVPMDDYGQVSRPEAWPPVGSVQTITYVEEGDYLDRRTGGPSDETTPEEFLEYDIAQSHDVDYTICAYVTVPYAMSYRYSTLGYAFILPVDRLAADSGQTPVPLFYLFDAPDAAAEAAAENYLADWTADDLSGLLYESKATLRAEFAEFQTMFLLLGGLLCAVVGLVGVLNFCNAILTGILARQREFAVLQAVGMTGRQLKTMLVQEGLFYALASALSALVLSLVLGPLVGDLLEQMFWFFRANFTVAPVLCSVPMFALLGWLIPRVMYARTTRHTLVDQLREGR